MTEAELIQQDVEKYLVKHQEKDLLRLLTAGSVDDGKSTLIGRLLYDSKTIYEDHLAKLEKDSVREGNVGDGQLDYSLLLDGLKAEREQGITIDVAYRYFSTEKRKFIIADTPGHEQYTRNMATGASTADLAIILVDAREGILRQTKRHSFISALLSIKHVVVAINKMDLVDYAQEAFDTICKDYIDFAAKLQINDVHFIPISALNGDNVIRRSTLMPWYNGTTLLDYLENVHIASDRNMIDLRFPVQCVLRPNLDFRGFAGMVASGILRQGDEILVLPSRKQSRIRSIITYDGELKEAFPPMSVAITLEDEIDVSRGDVIVHPNNIPIVDRTFDAMVVWMSEEPMLSGKNYLIKHTNTLATGTIHHLRYKINVTTLRRENADQLHLNEIGRVRVMMKRALVFDAYERNRATGAFIIIDRMTNITVGCGMIVYQKSLQDVAEKQGSLDPQRIRPKKKSLISAEERAGRLQQHPFVLWITGEANSNKTDVAYALERELFDKGYTAHVMDSEDFLIGVNDNDPDDERNEDIRKAGEIAVWSTSLGIISIGAFRSPYKKDRTMLRELVGKEKFIEVYMVSPDKTEQESCYEVSEKPELTLDCQGHPEKAVSGILTFLKNSGYIKKT